MNTQMVNAQVLAWVQDHPWMVALVVVWSIVWKLLALWKAAKKDQKAAFVILGILNTVGIIEIIYLAYYYFQEKKAIQGGVQK